MLNTISQENPLQDEEKVGMKLQQPRNKAPSSFQITAEQIIKESQAHRTDEIAIPIQVINDEDELNDFKLRVRKEFEDQLRRQKENINCWLKYADWEQHQTEFVRARSIYERAIEIDYKNESIWMRYAEMEMKHKFINYARNVFERACKLLPKVDKFWLNWTLMEEKLGNYIGAREIYKSWMSYNPDDKAWISFSKFEERMGQIDNCRNVLYDYMNVKNSSQSYIKVAKFEEKHHNIKNARNIYEKGIQNLGNEALKEKYFMEYIKFEMKYKNYDKCRELFKFALENIKEDKNKLSEFYEKFEKMYGTKETLDEMIIKKRKLYYENELEKNNMNYDFWFDYLKLEEDYGTKESIRELYEKAISNVPPINEKKYWRRYIYLWINYAFYEELINKDIERAGEIYKNVLNLIPHNIFTFGKIWILYAEYYIRNNNLDKARKIFGLNLAVCPKENVIKRYLNIEEDLGNIDRVRTIFQSYIEKKPENSKMWIKYAEFEKDLEEYERCESIYEAALTINLDYPEDVWKSYINSVYENHDKVINLYERLLKKSKHIKVWLSYIKYELEMEKIDKMRNLCQRAIDFFKKENLKKERKEIIEFWINCEKDDNEKERIKKMLPSIKKITKKNEEGIIEEVDDLVFPDDEKENKGLKILGNALKWNENIQE